MSDSKNIEDVPDCTSQMKENLRSQSTTRVSKSQDGADSKDGGTRRSSSETRHEIGQNSKKAKSQGAVKKKTKTPDLRNVFSKDPFIDYLETIKKEKGIHTMSEEQFWINQRHILQTLLKEGSELKFKSLNRKAVDKYKTAMCMILDHSLKTFRLTELDFIVLKYSISTCLLELSAYSDIIKAIEYLTDIHKNAKLFPAVYYGLGRAYKQLNRYKTAVEHLEKGSSFLNRELKFETQSWPETNVVIPETTREGLEDFINKMLKECIAYHEPDAICKYYKCRDISSHILPSEHIFISDPEFAGYVIISCEGKCRVEYHLTCWKDYKEKNSDEIGRHSDREFIGRNCPTADCFSQPNVHSVINKIQIIDGDASIKSTIEPSNTETSTIVKEKILSKKKKPDVTTSQSKTKPPKKLKKPLEVVKPIVIQETPSDNTVKDLEECLQIFDMLRYYNFGSPQEHNWDPRKMFFGNSDVQNLDIFISPEYAEETEKDRMEKDFVFSYFYEYLREEGPKKMDDVEKIWEAEYDFCNLGNILSASESICPFLLKSYRFAAVEDYICIPAQLPDAYKMAKKASVELVTNMFTKINNLEDSSRDAKERKISCTDEIQSLLNGVLYETESCDSESLALEREIVLHSEDQLISGSDVDDNDLHVEMIQQEFVEQKEYLESTLVPVAVEPSITPTQLANEQNIPHAEGPTFPLNLIPEHNDEKLIAVADIATITDAEWIKPVIEASHQVTQTEEYIDPEFVKCAAKVKELTQAQEEAKKKSDELTKTEKHQTEVIEKLLISKYELEQELNKLKLQKANEATALKETIAQKGKEIETLTKKLSIEKASCEELKSRISEIISETGKKSDLLKVREEECSQLRVIAVKAVQEKEDMRVNSSKQKCQDRLQILRCMLTSAEANTDKIPDIICDIKSWEAYLLKVKEYASKFKKLCNEMENNSTNFKRLEDLKFPEEPNCFYSTVEEMIIWITSDENKGKNKQHNYTAETKQQEKNASVNNLNTEGRPENIENYNRNVPSSQPAPQMYSSYGNLAGPALFQQHMPNSLLGAAPQSYYYQSNLNYRAPVPLMSLHTQMPRSQSPARNSWTQKNSQAPLSKEKQETEYKPVAVTQIPKTVTPPVVQQNGSLKESKKENEPPAETKISFKPSEETATPPIQPTMPKESNGSSAVPPLKPVNNSQSSTVTAATNTTTVSVTTTSGSQSYEKLLKHPQSYEKLMKHLHRHFPVRTEEELVECVSIARQRNNNTLSQVKLSSIIAMIEKILKEKASKKQGVTSLEKFGGSAWGEVSTDIVPTWSKSQDEIEECVICTDSLRDNKMQLQCKHTFHSEGCH